MLCSLPNFQVLLIRAIWDSLREDIFSDKLSTGKIFDGSWRTIMRHTAALFTGTPLFAAIVSSISLWWSSIAKQTNLVQSMMSVCASMSLRWLSFLENTLRSLKWSPFSRISGLISTTWNSGQWSTNTLMGSALWPTLLRWKMYPYTCSECGK